MRWNQLRKQGVIPYTHEAAEPYVAEVVYILRRRASKGNRWRRRAWNWIYTGIVKEGEPVREMGPFALAVYAGYVGLAIEYLGKHPDVERFAWLRGRVSLDLDLMIEYCNAAPYWLSTEEQYLIQTSLDVCNTYLAQIAILCPDTT